MLTVSSAFDYETVTSTQITITAAAGGHTITQNIAVTINDVSETVSIAPNYTKLWNNTTSRADQYVGTQMQGAEFTYILIQQCKSTSGANWERIGGIYDDQTRWFAEFYLRYNADDNRFGYTFAGSRMQNTGNLATLSTARYNDNNQNKHVSDKTDHFRNTAAMPALILNRYYATVIRNKRPTSGNSLFRVDRFDVNASNTDSVVNTYLHDDGTHSQPIYIDNSSMSKFWLAVNDNYYWSKKPNRSKRWRNAQSDWLCKVSTIWHTILTDAEIKSHITNYLQNGNTST